MDKTIVLVLLKPEDEDSQPFRNAIEGDPVLRERIELRFAAMTDASMHIHAAEVVVCGNLSPELLAQAQRLRWIAFWSAGMDGKVTPDLQARNLLLTNASGVHGPNIAEHVMMYMLMFMRNEPFYFRNQVARVWKRDNWGQEKWNRHPRRSAANELTGQTLGIVGLGRIGEALAVRARAFDMRIIATKRDPSTRYRAENLQNKNDTSHKAEVELDAIYGMDQLHRLLAESDHVCVTVPYTPDTHHLIDTAALAVMKPTAYLYNIGRGPTIDERALVEALQSDRLAGVGLDVFEAEPLPADSPLWEMENVIITPHVAGLTPYYFPRMAQLVADNLHRFLEGQPLRNLYDATRGY